MDTGEKQRQALRRKLARMGASRAAAPITSISPMLAETRARPFSAAGWIFELKYDGYRLLAERAADGAARLRYRSGRDASGDFAVLARAVAALPFTSLVLDGEVVALDPQGRPSFGLLQQRAAPWPPARRRRVPAGEPGHPRTAGASDPSLPVAATVAPIVFFAFDLLACEGYDLRPLPLAARREALLEVMAAAAAGAVLRCGEAVEQRGEDLWAAVAALGLEGIVAKRAASPYRAGRSADWLKVRADRVGDFAIVGYGLASPGTLASAASAPARAVSAAAGTGASPATARTAAGAAGSGAWRLAADLRRLHLAVWSDGGYRYVGSVGSGLAEQSRDQLGAHLAAAKPPPASRPGRPWLQGAPRPDARSVWVAPELVCEVRYKEWTSAGNLRQPVYLRLRGDKRPRECAAPVPAGDLDGSGGPG